MAQQALSDWWQEDRGDEHTLLFFAAGRDGEESGKSTSDKSWGSTALRRFRRFEEGGIATTSYTRLLQALLELNDSAMRMEFKKCWRVKMVNIHEICCDARCVNQDCELYRHQSRRAEKLTFTKNLEHGYVWRAWWCDSSGAQTAWWLLGYLTKFGVAITAARWRLECWKLKKTRFRRVREPNG